MKTLSKILGVIGGIVLFLLGLISLVGVVYSVIQLGFESIRVLWKSLVMAIAAFTIGIAIMKSAGKCGIGYIVMLILGVALILVEMYVWTGWLWATCETAIGLVSVDLMGYFLLYYDYVCIAIIACGGLGALFAIISKATSK